MGIGAAARGVPFARGPSHVHRPSIASRPAAPGAASSGRAHRWPGGADPSGRPPGATAHEDLLSGPRFLPQGLPDGGQHALHVGLGGEAGAAPLTMQKPLAGVQVDVEGAEVTARGGGNAAGKGGKRSASAMSAVAAFGSSGGERAPFYSSCKVCV